MSGRAVATPASAGGLLALVVLSGSVDLHAAEPLWEGDAGAPCRVLVEHPEGDLVLRSGGARLMLHGDPALWQAASGADGAGHVQVAGAAGSAASPSRPLELRAPAHCEVELRTDGGRIEIHEAPGGALRASSRTGDIVMWVTKRSRRQVQVATSGEITVDFSVRIDYGRHAEPAKRGVLVIGDGSSRAELTSRRGAVRVLKAERLDRRVR